MNKNHAPIACIFRLPEPTATRGWLSRRSRTREMWSLTAMPGLFLAYEEADAAGVRGIYGTATGLFAPVGIEYTSSNGWGAHVSVIDLGNLLNKRISGNEEDGVTVENNDTEFSDVLSLGIYARYKLDDTPFILGFGGKDSVQGSRQRPRRSGGPVLAFSKTRITHA